MGSRARSTATFRTAATRPAGSFQFFLAFLGGAAAQKGALWWAAHHRHHHKHSDTDEDLHSAKLEGFYWSHLGWVLSDEYEAYDPNVVKDLTKFPELVWLDKYIFVPPVAAAVACFLIDGWQGLVVGFFISTVVLYHTTFAINSLCHMFGKRRYETGEESKNSLWLAFLTMGEGWHNNHHHYPLSCRQGFFWYEIDIAYYILFGLSKLGIVWDLKAPAGAYAAALRLHRDQQVRRAGASSPKCAGSRRAGGTEQH